jgi:acetyl esterase/lipase
MKTFFLSLIPLQLLLLFTSCGQGMRNANNQNIKNKYLDIPYGNQSDAQKLDIYLPDSNLEKYPVIVSIHGGAFMMGDKADGQVNPMLQALNYGYAVVSVNYRLSGEAQFPAQIHDIKAAIRFIRANAAKYKLNSSKIAAWGGSAGGNLAALAGTSGNVTELEDLSQGNAEYSSRVQAVVDWFGPIDFCAMDQQFNESGKGKADHDAANSPESRLMGKPIQQIPELVKLANPETYITPDDPPFFIQHGTEDQLVPTNNR